MLTERALAMRRRDCRRSGARADAPPGTPERIVGDFWQSGMHASTDAGLDLLRDELRAHRPPRLARVRSRRTSATATHAASVSCSDFDVEPDFAAPDRTIACITQGGLGLPDRDDYFDTSPRGLARRRAYLAHVEAMLELCRNAARVDAGRRRARVRDRSSPPHRFRAERLHATSARGFARFPSTSPIAPIRAFRGAASSKRWTSARRVVSRWRCRRFTRRSRTPAQDAPRRSGARTCVFTRSTTPRLSSATSIRGGVPPFPSAKPCAASRRSRHAGNARSTRSTRTSARSWDGSYVARCFDSASKRHVERIAESLRAALRTRLENNPWMGEQTRRAALAKLSALTFKIGYPERWRDMSALVTDRSSLYANVLAARRFEQQRPHRAHRRRTDRTLWSMSPQMRQRALRPAAQRRSCFRPRSSRRRSSIRMPTRRSTTAASAP